jgi:hypothetical protein
MSDRVMPGPVQDSCGIREAVCIHTKKIYDSCRDKDCIEDLRVYPTRASQTVIDRALSVRGGRAELLRAYIDVEPAAYNRGFYSVDIRYYYRITAEAFLGGPRTANISGLAVFDKRVILFGSEGNAKVFTSRYQPEGADPQLGLRSNLPEAVVEAVDPIVLSLRLSDLCDYPCPCPPGCVPPCPPPPPPCGPAGPGGPGGGPGGPGGPGCGPVIGVCGENELTEIPLGIEDYFDGELSFESACRRLCVTLGQFSIIRLERDSQLLIPMYDYCLPNRECCAGGDENGEEDPCEVFRQIRFPVGEFFPPSCLPGMEDDGCGCNTGCGSGSCSTGCNPGCNTGCGGNSGTCGC